MLVVLLYVTTTSVKNWIGTLSTRSLLGRMIGYSLSKAMVKDWVRATLVVTHGLIDDILLGRGTFMIVLYSSPCVSSVLALLSLLVTS